MALAGGRAPVALPPPAQLRAAAADVCGVDPAVAPSPRAPAPGRRAAPSDVGLEHPDLPRTGTLAERVAATRLLELRLCEEVQRLGDPTVTALPIGATLEAPGTGALDARFTEDGVHVNPLGAERVRAAL